VVGQHLAHGQVAIEVAVLGHDRDPSPCGEWVVGHVRPVDRDPAAGRPNEGIDAAEGGALARAVGPEEPEELARGNREGQAPNGLDGGDLAPGGIRLDEVLDSEHGFLGRSRERSTFRILAQRLGPAGQSTRDGVAHDHASVLHDGLQGGCPNPHEVEEPLGAQDEEIGRFPTSRLPTSASSPTE
jgi:hypothetical protein